MLSLDKFYSSDGLAHELVNRARHYVGCLDKYTIIEPSAGSGQILKYLPENSLAFDICPDRGGIIKCDFLSTPHNGFKNIVYIGNPPFGKCASKAVAFFNRCALDGEVIAMILPKTFEKIFFHNKLNRQWHLEETYHPDACIFQKDGARHRVPCVIQIWKRKNHLREVVGVNNIYFEIVNQNEAEYSIRRVGGKAGMVLEGVHYSSSSTFFVKDLIVGTKERIKSLYPRIKEEASKTVGVRSITSNEIAYILDEHTNDTRYLKF